MLPCRNVVKTSAVVTANVCIVLRARTVYVDDRNTQQLVDTTYTMQTILT